MIYTNEKERENYVSPECATHFIVVRNVLCSSPEGGIDDLTVEDFDWS